MRKVFWSDLDTFDKWLFVIVLIQAVWHAKEWYRLYQMHKMDRYGRLYRQWFS